jgi:hypothetical protein
MILIFDEKFYHYDIQIKKFCISCKNVGNIFLKKVGLEGTFYESSLIFFLELIEETGNVHTD